MDKLIIRCCLNDNRMRDLNPNVPYTPEELAAEAQRAYEAGAAIVHLHARTPDGGITHDPKVYARIDELIRARCPVILNHTTARSWDTPLESVLAYLRDTPQPVDMALVNYGHMATARKDPKTGKRRSHITPNSYEDMAATLAVCEARGIFLEPAVFDVGYVNNVVTMARDGVLKQTRYFLIELLATWGGGQQRAPDSPKHYELLRRTLAEHFPDAVVLAHGTGETTLQTAAYIMAAGGHVCVGFEDWPLLPGRVPTSNAEIVDAAVRIARALGREPASPAEARAMLGMPPRP